jgi:rhodanese-related sulfurtransferase
MNPTEKRHFKTVLFSQFAQVGKALGNNHRLELLELLAQGERRVDSLAQDLGLPVANTSQHLQILHSAGLLESRRSGTAIFYRLSHGAFGLWQVLRDLAQARLPEINHLVSQTLERPDKAVNLNELQQLLATGQAVLLDVRPQLEYDSAHIPSAISAPLEELEKLLPNLPKDRQIVAYCRGPFCVFADQAVALLRQKGYNATRLEYGLPDWQAAGYPVQQGVSA